MDNFLNILLVEDSPSLAAAYKGYLKGDDYKVTHVEKGLRAINELKCKKIHCVLLDLALPDISGLEVLNYIQSNKIPVSVVVITAHGTFDNVVAAMRLGAFDFLVKPFNADRLKVTLKNAVEHKNLEGIVKSYQETYEKNHFHGFIGSSLSMQGVYRIIESAAQSNATVFIQGESGTGKEVCAEAVHKESNRKEKPFVALNCAAIPGELIESEIFGHVKGAFTGANRDRTGAATKANGGTLFLDEICEMNIDLQSKLLRFVQTGTFNRVGSDELEKVDIRIICATNKDPLKEVEAGNFREDLYYRLHVIPIEIPALRDRKEDIMKIATYYLDKYSKEEKRGFIGFDKIAEKLLSTYNWPGNIRELQNIIRNIVVLNDDRVVDVEHLPPQVQKSVNTHGDNVVPLNTVGASKTEQTAPVNLGDIKVKPLWQIEKEAIENTIKLCGGNVTRAAAILGVSASTIYRKLQSWEGEEIKHKP